MSEDNARDGYKEMLLGFLKNSLRVEFYGDSENITLELYIEDRPFFKETIMIKEQE